MAPERYVTADVGWDTFAGRGDPEQQYRLYRVCPGETTPELVATCGSPEALGVAIVTLGREQMFKDCALGVLHVEGEPGERWLQTPWRAMPKEVSAAGRVLARARKKHDR
jgi:hypothetical protein